ncbi:MAG TPA: hypothetical protein VH913_04395 [Hyphomicrobiaceae bacterium]
MTTIPSVREVVVVYSTRVLAEILRRGPDGRVAGGDREDRPRG